MLWLDLLTIEFVVIFEILTIARVFPLHGVVGVGIERIAAEDVDHFQDSVFNSVGLALDQLRGILAQNLSEKKKARRCSRSRRKRTCVSLKNCSGAMDSSSGSSHKDKEVISSSSTLIR